MLPINNYKTPLLLPPDGSVAEILTQLQIASAQQKHDKETNSFFLLNVIFFQVITLNVLKQLLLKFYLNKLYDLKKKMFSQNIYQISYSSFKVGSIPILQHIVWYKVQNIDTSSIFFLFLSRMLHCFLWNLTQIHKFFS